jgi:hypothetical protein
VRVGAARGKGNLGETDARLDWGEATQVLTGADFCGRGLLEAVQSEDGEVGEVVRRIAPLVPEHHVF